MKTSPDLVKSVGIVQPTGRRFGVADATNQFILQDGGDERGKITFYAKRNQDKKRVLHTASKA
jgi:hypothetical protein